MSIKKPRILFWDMETRPLQAWIWGCGKQVIRHKQLVKDNSRFGIICITYCWNDGTPAKVIDWGYKKQDTAKVVKEFDAILKTADHAIGKNSNRFDNKMLNAARMFADLPAMPDWVRYTDDLEVQMRRYFRLPSFALDYISHELGYGGKMKMDFQDWIDIVEKNENGPKSFNKMLRYGKKDVIDTRALWNHLSKHFEPKLNVAAFVGDGTACVRCGGTNMSKDGTRTSGFTVYQMYKCRDCKTYGGRRPLSKVLKSEGRIR